MWFLFLIVVIEYNNCYKVFFSFVLMVGVGERYRHFKGGEYEVVSLAWNCDKADEELVVYRAFIDGRIWVRLLDEFCGDKVFDDGRRVKRFELIDGKS